MLRHLAIGLLVWTMPFLLPAQEILRSELRYTTLNDEVLGMDYYANPADQGKQLPCILFIHGGSFMYGTKRESYIIPYAIEWAKRGYRFVSISYRLTLKGKSFHCDLPANEKVSTFEHAVYDLRSATQKLIALSDSLGIDTSKIILAGNSAGAEAVLHAAYWKNSEHNVGPPPLSDAFRYAGVLAYAGAIVDTSLITNENRIPTALFHGNCDQYVPYATATHHYCPEKSPGGLLLHGSASIRQRLQHLGGDYFMYTLVNGKHRVNTLGMLVPLDQTIAFVNESVLRHQSKQVHLVEKSSEESCTFVEIDFCD